MTLRWIGLLLPLLLVACNQTSPARGSPAPPSPRPLVYVALGASETFGSGTEEPARDAFPLQLVARLPRGSVLYNFGIPSETTAAALNDELPEAVLLHPDVATVFFNVDDLVAGVSPAAYEANLDQIVAGLRASGRTRVLVASTAPLDQLPVFEACRQGASGCPLVGVPVPSAEAIRALVGQYNAAIARVAQSRGAVPVDLSGVGPITAKHPEYLSADGFHPSTAGARALAEVFYAAYVSSG